MEYKLIKFVQLSHQHTHVMVTCEEKKKPATHQNFQSVIFARDFGLDHQVVDVT